MSSDTHAAEHSGASVRTYSWVAVFLAIVTAVEVVVLFVDVSAWKTLVLWSLYIIMAVKFAYVAAYFMHLLYDDKWYTILFNIGLVIALGTYVALRLMIDPIDGLPGSKYRSVESVEVFRGEEAARAYAIELGLETAVAAEAPVPAAADTESPGEQLADAQVAAAAAAVDEAPTPAAGGDPEAGARVFTQLGCGSCHVVADLPGAVGTIGPKLDGLAAIAGQRVPGQDADAYLRESIADPNAFVVDGYMKVMPPMRGAMSDQQFEDLIAFLKTL